MTDPNQCSECGGKLIYGPPLHNCHSSFNGVPTELYWCITCAEYISSASWDYETNGPYPFTTTGNDRGRA